MEKPLAFCTLLRYTVYKDSVKKFIKIIKNLLMQKGRSRYEHWWYPDRCVHRHYGDCRCGKPQQEKRRRGTAVNQKKRTVEIPRCIFLYGLCPSQGRLFALPQLLPRSRRQTRSKGVRPPRGRWSRCIRLRRSNGRNLQRDCSCHHTGCSDRCWKLPPAGWSAGPQARSPR